MDLDKIPALLNIANVLETSPEVALYVSLAVIFAAFLVTYLVIRLTVGGPKVDTIAIVGLCGSGKTSLFFQLRDGSMHGGTVTSMEPNEGRFPLHSELPKNPKAPPVHIVDLPGHPRLRPKLEEVLRQTRAVVFMVDSLDFMPQLRATAELLYEVLTNGSVVRRRVPVLLVCNKTDKVSAHSVGFIRKQLEKEIDKLRVTRSAISDADVGTEVVLGTKGEPFKFSQCVNKVTEVEASVLTGKVADIESFIREHVRA